MYAAKINKFLSNLSIWRRVLIAFLMGALVGFAFPPFNVTLFAFIGFPVLAFLIQTAKTRRQAFALGWNFSFGLLIVCLHWIAKSMFVDIAAFWWAIPLAVGGLPAFFALYYALASALVWPSDSNKRKNIVSLAFNLALLWFVADMARAHLLTGFPWDITGYIWGDRLPMMQSTSVIGIAGLTLVTLILCMTPALMLGASTRRATYLWGWAALLVLVILSGWGVWRLANAPQEFVENVRLRLVQPDIEQESKWDVKTRADNLEKILKLSFTETEEKPTHIIWPETATAYFLPNDTNARRKISKAQTFPAYIITGTVRRSYAHGGVGRYYNSLIALDPKSTVVAFYDKTHLVPFGEYIPLQEYLPINPVADLGMDFSSGEGNVTLRVRDLPPFSPLICYEAIFSGEVIDETDKPSFMINVTNDGWYEGTIGPWQHFMIARARAIEESLPLVRVANKGVTAIVDAYGRILNPKASEPPYFADYHLPKEGEILLSAAMRQEITLYLFIFLSLIGFSISKESANKIKRQ